MFSRRRLDVDLLDSSTAVRGDVRDHLRDVRGEPRCLRNHRRIEVSERVPGSDCLLPDATQQRAAVRVLVSSVRVGEMRTDVAGAQRAKNRIADRVQQHIGVGMTVESALMGNSHASQHEAAACDERVYVEPVADARLRGRHSLVRRCSRIASARATSSG